MPPRVRFVSERDAPVVMRLEVLTWSKQSQGSVWESQGVWSKMAEELPPLLTVHREAIMPTRVAAAMMAIEKKSCGLCAFRGPQAREN